MKTWNVPTIEELDVNQTAFSFSGNVDDGYYDGGISGLDNDFSVENKNDGDPVDQLS